MVKVLSRGSQDLKAVGRHIDYLRDREEGELDFETDDGRRFSGERATKELIENWDLQLEEHRSRADLGVREAGSKRLVHKLLFSMPAGTPPPKVLEAVKNFAREEFGFKHRYAMVLHTDEPHPHVHMVLKAVSERDERLHIRKATLRHWRQEFARHLRALGVEANATERAVRGEPRKSPKDGIYRAALRGDSTHVRARTEGVAAEIFKGDLSVEAAKLRLIQTRQDIERGGRAAGGILVAQGRPEVAGQVQRFLDRMPPPMTDREAIAAALISSARQRRVRTETIQR